MRPRSSSRSPCKCSTVLSPTAPTYSGWISPLPTSTWRAFFPGRGQLRSTCLHSPRSQIGSKPAPSARQRAARDNCSGSRTKQMPGRRLTRRQTLALGLAGVMLPRPFIAGRTVMAQSTPDTVVYVSNAASKEIYILAMNRDNGDLTLLDMVSVPGTDKPSPSSMPMAVTPDRRFLYAALRSDSFPASSFAIDHANGRLTHLATTLLQDSMAYIVTDRTGRYLLSASYPGNKLTINPINDMGHIVEQATQIIPDRPKAHCVIVDSANKHVYATSLGADII